MNKLKVDLNCPKCKRHVSIKLEEMIPGKTKHCPGCNSEIVFTGDDGRKVQRELGSFQRKLKGLFK